MSFYSYSIQINRPKLDKEEIWYRNQYHKNWGNLSAVKFRNGDPLILLPPIKSMAILASYLFIVIGLGLKSGLHPIFSLAVALAQGSLYIIASKYKHQVASSGIPILNQEEFYNYRGFCKTCLVFTGKEGVSSLENENEKSNKVQQIEHCHECGTCFYDPIYHSTFLGFCVTNSNYWRFFFYQTIFFLSTLFMILINFF